MEWESGSGHQITIGDVAVNELSKVEYQAIQRLAITMLQGLDIPVSHGLLKGMYVCMYVYSAWQVTSLLFFQVHVMYSRDYPLIPLNKDESMAMRR